MTRPLRRGRGSGLVPSNLPKSGSPHRKGAACLRLYDADEAESLARDRADQFLIFAAVADRLSRGVDAASQRRFRNDPVAPHRADEIVLADNAVAVLQQINQKVEHLRLNVDQVFGIPEFAPLEVDLVFFETKNHSGSRDNEAEDSRSKPQQS